MTAFKKLIITIYEEFKTDGEKRHGTYYVRIKRSIELNLLNLLRLRGQQKNALFHILPIFEKKGFFL